MLNDSTLEFWVFHPSAQDVKQVELLLQNTPSCANRIVVQFTGFVCRIPALENEVELLGLIGIRVSSEPFRLHQATTGRCRQLLILASKVVFAEIASDPLEYLERLSLRMQGLSSAAFDESNS